MIFLLCNFSVYIHQNRILRFLKKPLPVWRTIKNIFIISLLTDDTYFLSIYSNFHSAYSYWASTMCHPIRTIVIPGSWRSFCVFDHLYYFVLYTFFLMSVNWCFCPLTPVLKRLRMKDNISLFCFADEFLKSTLYVYLFFLHNLW